MTGRRSPISWRNSMNRNRSQWRAGATALVLDAGRTLIIDRNEFVRLADENDIAVVGFEPMA